MNTPTLGGLFLRFQMISFWGLGGGLQFFSTCPVKCADKWIYFEPTNKCYKYFPAEKGPISANNYCQSNFKAKLKIKIKRNLLILKGSPQKKTAYFETSV